MTSKGIIISNNEFDEIREKITLLEKERAYLPYLGLLLAFIPGLNIIGVCYMVITVANWMV